MIDAGIPPPRTMRVIAITIGRIPTLMEEARTEADPARPLVVPVRTQTVVFVAVAVLLVVIYWIMLLAADSWGSNPPRGFRKLFALFDLDGENNLPAWFSTALWLYATALAFAAGGQKTEVSARRWWMALAAVFAFLSLDEAASLHEKLAAILNWLKPGAGFHAGYWVVVGMLFCLVFGAVFLRFLVSLPRLTLFRMVVAGIVFVAGAVGMEMAGFLVIARQGGPGGIAWHLCVTVEEFLEFVGVILLVRALLIHIAGPSRDGEVRFGILVD